MDFGSALVYVVSYFGLFTAIFFMITLYENRKRLKNPKPQKDLPSVTVAVPAFNEEKTIAATVESLLALNYPKGKLTIVVIDDGSKDKTLEIARKFEKKGVIVYTKPNAGKGSALNYALSKCDSELFGALDADSFVHPLALIRMVGYFKDEKVTAVTPSLIVHKPKNILQKIQYIEYMIGIFLRKMFGFLQAIHVTPGPFTIYRKKFFDEFGGYDEYNLTEDIEIALRIQKNRFRIENSVDATVYTVSPSKFKPLLNQRLRWYIGFTENVARYKELFSKKYGDLGVFILPAAFISVILVMITLVYTLFKMTTDIYAKYLNWKAVNYEFWKLKWINTDLFYMNINSLMVLSFVSLLVGIFVIYAAKKMSKQDVQIKAYYFLYLIFYWMLFGFWWIAASIYLLLGKRVSWGQRNFK